MNQKEQLRGQERIFILGNEAEDEIELPNLPEYVAADFAIYVNCQIMYP